MEAGSDVAPRARVAFKAKTLVRTRMIHAKSYRPKLKRFAPARLTIDAIAHDGPALLCELRGNLVLAPGMQPHAHDPAFLIGLLDLLILADRVLAASSVRGRVNASVFVFDEPRFDATAGGIRTAKHHRLIKPL